ncbi:hypothetical protein AB0425_06410 [Actinosynnema sp. NPDC051121]
MTTGPEVLGPLEGGHAGPLAVVATRAAGDDADRDPARAPTRHAHTAAEVAPALAAHDRVRPDEVRSAAVVSARPASGWDHVAQPARTGTTR